MQSPQPVIIFILVFVPAGIGRIVGVISGTVSDVPTSGLPGHLPRSDIGIKTADFEFIQPSVELD